MVIRLPLIRPVENVTNCRATICHSEYSLTDGMLTTINKLTEEITMDILIVLAVFIAVCGLMLFLNKDKTLVMSSDLIPEDSMLRRHFYTELEAKRQARKV